MLQIPFEIIRYKNSRRFLVRLQITEILIKFHFYRLKLLRNIHVTNTDDIMTINSLINYNYNE